MSSTSLKLSSAAGLLGVLALVLLGCSTSGRPDTGGRVPVLATGPQPELRPAAREPTPTPDRRHVPPRVLTEEELAEQEITNTPNGVFTGYGEMIHPEDGIIELPTVYKAKNIKPPPHPPVSIDLRTGQVTVLPQPLVQPDPQPAPADHARADRTPGLEVSFQGMGTSAVAPSDAEVAAGPENVISAVNSRYRLHSKTGTTLASASQTSLHGISMCCDARAIYDPDSQRYFVSSLVNSCTPRIAVAMSKTSTPSNLSAGTSPDRDWLTWAFSLPGTNRFPDFPQIGVDENAVYLTGNMFNCSTGAYLGVTLMVIPKAQLLAGATNPTSTSFTNLRESWSGANYQAFTVVPTVAFGSPGLGILAEHFGQATMTDDENNSLNVNVITLFIVHDPAGTPTLSDFPVFVHRSGINPPNAQQLGSSIRLATNGPELHGLTYRDGSLWAAHTARKTTPSVKSRVSWIEIDVGKALDSATRFYGWEQAGFIERDDYYYYFPKLTVDRYGNAGLAMCESSTSEYASVYYTTRASDDPPGTFDTPALMKAGTSPYTAAGSPSRWGDYCGIALDPANDRTFWATGQWAQTTSAWSTWIGSFTMSAQTTTLPFFEDFEFGGRGVTPGLWSLVTGQVDGVGTAEPSGSNSARLNGPDKGQDQFRTRQIDLTSAANVEVSYWIQRGGGGDAPETVDLLTVDYVDADGNWSNLRTFNGTGSTESTYTQYSHQLPAGAYHDHFRLRFSTATAFLGDDWFVDDVAIRDCGAVDSDGDGTYDNCDACPFEPALLEPSEPDAEESCADAVDNDCDGLTDAADGDCQVGLPCSCGDINQSGGLVDLNDFATFANCFGLSAPAAGCDATGLACSDLNGDGVVDLNDFGTFALVFGLASTNTPPNCP